MNPNLLYWTAKARIWRNWLFSQAGRPLRSVLTLLVMGAIWLALYGLFYSGFTYAQLVYFLDVYLISGMFGIFLLLVFLLLILSGAVLGNTGLYHSREATLLMTIPLAPERAALYRSMELGFFNSLAALYLITPLVAAYAVVEEIPTAWLVQDLLLLLPLLVIPNALGFSGSILVRLGTGRVSRRGIIVTGIVVTLAAFYLLLSTFDFGVFDENQHPVMLLNQTANALKGTRAWFLPTYWYVEAVFSPARGHPNMTIWFGGVLVTVASALMIAWVGVIRRWYYPSWLRETGQAKRPARALRRVNRLAQWAHRLEPLPETLRTLLAKDALLFVRDHVVRTQGLIMVGLLLVYFASLRSLYSGLVGEPWQKFLISIANFAALGILLSAFGCRFFLPLVGVEGRKFWLLRTAPPSLGLLLVEKWLFGTLVLLALGHPLLALSNYMTAMDRVFVTASHVALLLVIPPLVGVCVGLGAVFPDFDEAGSAGTGVQATFAFVLCMLCVGGVLLLLLEPYWYYVQQQTFGYDVFLRRLIRNVALGAGAGWTVGLGLLLMGRYRLGRAEIA